MSATTRTATCPSSRWTAPRSPTPARSSSCRASQPPCAGGHGREKPGAAPLMHPFEYAAPETLDQALGLLGEHGDDAKVLAGGQSLIPILHYRLARPRAVPDTNRLLRGALGREHGRLPVAAPARYHQVAASRWLARA